MLKCSKIIQSKNKTYEKQKNLQHVLAEKKEEGMIQNLIFITYLSLKKKNRL